MYTSFLRLGRAFAPTRDALIHFAILAGLLSLATIARAQISITHLSTYATGSYNTSAAEIVTYDPVSDRIFFVNAQLNEVRALNASNPAAPTLAFTISMAAYGAGANSVTVVPGGIAVAVEANPKTDPGKVVFFDAAGTFISQVTVGALPDMVTVTPDGTKVLVANEGEPNTAYTIDPLGTVSVIDITGGLATLTNANVTTIDFSAYTPVMIPGVRIFGPGASVAQDMEPEYITVSDDSQKAYVACQENNAVVRINLASNAIEQITALGWKDHSLAGNGIDASDSPTGINIATWPVRGLYMPDAIDSYTVGGQTYVVYANEGDAREYTPLTEPRRIGSATYVLDPTVFPNAATLKANANLGRLNATISNGDIDSDGDYDEIYVFGSRSFTIRDANGVIVYDSGDDFEQITSAALAANFNCNNSANGTFDTRSDDKGPEPEAVALGKVGSQTYAFIGLERIGGVMVYDVTIPTAPVFIQYLNHRNFAGNAAAGTALDLGVESIVFVSAAQSPDGKPFIITSNEISGTVSLFRIDGPAYTGCSSSQSPYLKPIGAGRTTTSILTVGDLIGGYDMVGIPDGMGAYDNNNGTFTLLLNHEIGATEGIPRAHGSVGAFVSKWIINKSDLCVQSGADLITTVNLWNVSGFTTGSTAFNRFCAGDLPEISALYNAGTGKGTQERIYLNGEEAGNEGRAFAHIATGPNAGTTYQLPYLGRFSWENAIANPATGDKTVVVGTDDTTPGQVYFYVGSKQSTGTEIERAGLNNGKLFGVAVSGLTTEVSASFVAPNTAFTLVDLGFVQNTTGAALQTASVTAGVTQFLRPEDGAWDASNPSDFYFVTTNSFAAPSRMYKLHFTDILNPELGGTITAVLDGTEAAGQKMMDNMCIDTYGQAWIQEDPGNQAYIARIHKYDIATDVLTPVAYHDSTRFLTGGANFLTQDEESSGIIDMKSILGPGRYIINDQAHHAIPGELVQGGQLLELRSGDTTNVCVPAAITAITDTTLLCGVDTLELNTAATGTLPLTYSWNGTGSYLFGNNSPSALVTGATSGYFIVTATNACGTAVDTVVVTVTPQAMYYADVDGDGFGDPAADSLSCSQPAGFVTNNTDNCPSVVGVVGSTCDDGDANTTGDVIDANCVCAGTPVPCAGNEVTFELTTDASASETSWDIVLFNTNTVVCSGSGYSNLSTISEQCCLPDGCYDLRVFDSFGDGINPGGSVLRDENNNRILDNANDGIFTSVSKAPGGFCLPLGTDQLTVATCDQEALSSANVIQAVVNPAVSAQLGISNATSGYQFWIFNPDGGYSRTIFKSIASPGAGYPAATPVAQRPAYLRLSSIVTSPVPGFTLLNVRVRSRVNGAYSAYGPACRMKLDPLGNCSTTQLVNNLQSNQHSCGVTGKVVNNIDKIYANVVAGANRYQFRFENTTEGYVRSIASTTNALTLNKWTTAPLLCGTFTYDVTVRVSFDGGASYCPYGAVCTVGITNNAPNPCTAPFQGGGGNLNSVVEGTRASDLAIWPNPTRDGRVTLELNAIVPGTQEVTITVFDLFGKQVMASTIGLEGAEQLNTVLQLPELSTGMYTVQVAAGTVIHTRRLVVE